MVSVVELKNMGGGSIFFVHVCPLFGFLFSGFFWSFFFLLSASFCDDSMFHMLSIS